MRRSPLFICFTGVDGSGKSSHARLLQQHFHSLGIKAIYMWARWEPFFIRPVISAFKRNSGNSSGDPSGADDFKKNKRTLLDNRVVLWLWLNLSLLDYYIQVRRKIKHLPDGVDIIICDRYLFDYIVDQAVNMGSQTKGMEHIMKLPITRLFGLPDLLLVLDVIPEIAHKRKQDMTIEYLSERRNLYRHLGKLSYVKIINANDSFDIVFGYIIEGTTNLLRARGLIND